MTYLIEKISSNHTISLRFAIIKPYVKRNTFGEKGFGEVSMTVERSQVAT